MGVILQTQGVQLKKLTINGTIQFHSDGTIQFHSDGIIRKSSKYVFKNENNKVI